MPIKQQIFALVISLLVFVFTIDLVRKKRLREEYSVLWRVSGTLDRRIPRASLPGASFTDTDRAQALVKMSRATTCRISDLMVAKEICIYIFFVLQNPMLQMLFLPFLSFPFLFHLLIKWLDYILLLLLFLLMLFFLFLLLPELGTKEGKGNLSVLLLEAFLTGLYDDSGGFMGKSDRGRHFINILSAVPSTGCKLPLKVLCVNLNVGFFNFG